jgi:disulfide bond formation protein DsbB
VVVLLLGLNALIALIHAPKTRVRRVYAINGAGLGALGFLVAGRHVYLQSLPPDKAPECGPGLEYLLETLPFNQAIMKIFTGSGECASVDWTLAGLSMPAWVLIAMVLFCLLSVGSMWMKPIDDEARTNHI